MDRLDLEIIAILKRAAHERKLAEEHSRAADELEREARILRRAAELRPVQTDAPEMETLHEHNVERVLAQVRRGGRQPGSISKEWRGVLADMAASGPVDSAGIALLAKRRGMELQERSAGERARDYVSRGFLEIVDRGLYRVTALAVAKFDLTRTVEDDNQNNSAPQADTASGA